MGVIAIILYGAINSVLLTVVLLVMILKSPRLLLQDYPKEIIKIVPPKTKEEKRLSRMYTIPFFMVLIAYPTNLGWFYTIQTGWNFWETMTFVWGIMLFVNIYDLLIIDWLIVCAITPKFIIIPGTEGSSGYKNYFFHFVGFLKGIVITFVLSLIITGFIKLTA